MQGSLPLQGWELSAGLTIAETIPTFPLKSRSLSPSSAVSVSAPLLTLIVRNLMIFENMLDIHLLGGVFSVYFEKYIFNQSLGTKRATCD